MSEQQAPETAQVVNEQDVAVNENPVVAALVLGDAYMDNLYNNSRNGVTSLLSNVAFADGKKLVDLLGPENIGNIGGFITNDIILPLVYAMGDMHSSTNTLMGTIFKTLQRDSCLHKISDIFLLQQSLIQLTVSTNVYFDRTQFDDKYPAADNWSFNLMEMENAIAKRDLDAGITYKADETPYRNEFIEVVDIKGNHMPNCRFVNFTYTNTVTNEQELTDIPAIWNDDINEYIFLPLVLKWRFANKLPTSLMDQEFSADTISKGFLAQTTETHEQVHQQRVATRQAALEEAEEKRKADEAAAQRNKPLQEQITEHIRDAVATQAKESNFQEAVDAQKVADDLLEQNARALDGLQKPLSEEAHEEKRVAPTPDLNLGGQYGYDAGRVEYVASTPHISAPMPSNSPTETPVSSSDTSTGSSD